MSTLLREHAEQQFAEELHVLAETDRHPRPPNWHLSPRAVTMYLLGGTLDSGFAVTPKYIGNRRLMEVAVATLATDRALLLLGVPGTAKTWVSEHLAAAISGDSTALVQGTAGTGEDAIRYGWNYARLLAEGPSLAALVPSPVMRAMQDGSIARVEELTRIPSDVQDALITVLSEKTLPIPELDTEVQALKGFNLIATANDRDRGGQRTVQRPEAAFQHRGAADPGYLGRGSRDRPAAGGRAGPGLGVAGRSAGAGGNPPAGDHLPRTARRGDAGRQGQAEIAQRRPERGRGDFGAEQRPGAGGAFRRRAFAGR